MDLLYSTGNSAQKLFSKELLEKEFEKGEIHGHVFKNVSSEDRR